jgi:hypothetical protein
LSTPLLGENKGASKSKKTWRTLENPKFEARNTKKAPYHAAFVLDFEHLDFGFVSDFEIRISCFKENDVALWGRKKLPGKKFSGQKIFLLHPAANLGKI